MRVVRLSAWSVALGAVAVVALRYDALPETLPLTRWSAAPKTWLTALRVPAICLVSLGLVELICASIRRLPGCDYRRSLTAILLLTAAWKSAASALSLILLPAEILLLDVLWISLTLLGVALALWQGRDLMRAGRLRQLRWTRLESALGIVLGCLLLALQLPLLAGGGRPG